MTLRERNLEQWHCACVLGIDPQHEFDAFSRMAAAWEMEFLACRKTAPPPRAVGARLVEMGTLTVIGG